MLALARSGRLARTVLAAIALGGLGRIARADGTTAPLSAPDQRAYRAGDPYNWRRPMAWTTLVLAGLAGAGGYAFQRARDRHVTQRDSTCDSGTMPMGGAGCALLDTQIERAGKLAIGGYVGGGAFALLSLYLFATDEGEDSSLAIAPVGGHWGVAWGGRF
jgi:hypothetical protein